jgi:hypothetical protein
VGVLGSRNLSGKDAISLFVSLKRARRPAFLKANLGTLKFNAGLDQTLGHWMKVCLWTSCEPILDRCSLLQPLAPPARAYLSRNGNAAPKMPQWQIQCWQSLLLRRNLLQGLPWRPAADGLQTQPLATLVVPSV